MKQQINDKYIRYFAITVRDLYLKISHPRRGRKLPYPISQIESLAPVLIIPIWGPPSIF